MEPSSSPWVVIIVAVFGAGGLVSLVRSVLDWSSGKAQKESETDVRYLLNREKRIRELEKRIDTEMRYEADLIRALARGGLEVPDRRD